MYFKRYCKLKFKNKAKFCVQICPIFAGPVTFMLFNLELETQLKTTLIISVLDSHNRCTAPPDGAMMLPSGIKWHPLARICPAYKAYELSIILRPIMLKFYLLRFWAVLKKVTDYAHYHAHEYCNYVTVYIEFHYYQWLRILMMTKYWSF